MKNTKQLLLAFTTLVLCFTALATTSSLLVSAAKLPIPAGCPGSKIQGPGTVDCSKIPYGCPGSSVPYGTAPTSVTVCKYDADATPTATPAPTQTDQTTTNANSFCLQNDSCDTALPKVSANRANLQTILQIVFGILGLVAVIFIVIGGIKFALSEGDPQNTSQARQTIMYAVIGLVIAVSAEAIVSFVLRKL